jgi:hypothetical protein
VSFMHRIIRHTAVIGILGVTTITAACTAQTAPASEGSAPSPAPAASAPAASTPVTTSTPGTSTTPGTAPPPTSGYEGFLEKMSCDMLRGWAWDTSQPDRPLKIELYDGDRLLKTVVADQYRQDLADAHKGNGRHLFIESPAPAELRDGKAHIVRAVVKDAGYALRPLADTPTSLTCTK